MLKKIEKDTNTVKTSRRMILTGWIAIILSIVLSLSDFSLPQGTADFITAAAPWVLLGLGIAFLCAPGMKK